MSWSEAFFAHLSAPAEKCSKCGHHLENHEGVMGVNACIWCPCGHKARRAFDEGYQLPDWLHETWDRCISMVGWAPD